MVKKVQKKQQKEKQQKESINEIEQEEIETENNFVGLQEEEQKPEPNQLILYEDEIEQKINEIQSDFKKRLKLKPKEGLNWHEHMSLVSDSKIEVEQMEVADDVQREVQFYNIALENVNLACKYLQTENIPIRRPDDYFAEMFKTDKQMNKIKNRLVEQQQRVENFEEKELKKQQKKNFKVNKAKTQEAKHKEKRDNLAAIDEWKKEITNKGEKARDLSDFMLKNRNLKKGQQQQGQKGGKGGNNQKGGKVGRQNKPIQKGGKGQQQNSVNKKGTGASSRHKKGKGGGKGGKFKSRKTKRGHQ